MITGDLNILIFLIFTALLLVISIRHLLLPEGKEKHYALFLNTVYPSHCTYNGKITRSPVLLNCESEIHSIVTFPTSHNDLQLVGCI